MMPAKHFSKYLLIVLIAFSSNASAQPEHAFPQHFLQTSDGASIAFYTRNVQPNQTPLIVISGGPGTDHRYMNAAGAFEQLADLRPLVMYDQRATGSSAPAPETPTIDLWVADIEALRKQLGVDQVDLLGHSFGGYLAMSYAAAHADNVRKLILVDSAPPDITSAVSLLADVYPDRFEQWRELRAGLEDQFAAEQIRLFFSMEFVDPDWGDRYTSYVTGLTYDISVNNALRQDMQQRELASQLSHITAPALVLHGRFDAILAPSNSYNIHQQLPNSAFTVFEQSGHAPFVEQPELFVQTVNQYLKQKQ